MVNQCEQKSATPWAVVRPAQACKSSSAALLGRDAASTPKCPQPRLLPNSTPAFPYQFGREKKMTHLLQVFVSVISRADPACRSLRINTYTDFRDPPRLIGRPLNDAGLGPQEWWKSPLGVLLSTATRRLLVERWLNQSPTEWTPYPAQPPVNHGNQPSALRAARGHE